MKTLLKYSFKAKLIDCVGVYLTKLITFPRHNEVKPSSRTSLTMQLQMPVNFTESCCLVLRISCVWRSILTRSKGAIIILDMNEEKPPSIMV